MQIVASFFLSNIVLTSSTTALLDPYSKKWTPRAVSAVFGNLLAQQRYLHNWVILGNIR